MKSNRKMVTLPIVLVAVLGGSTAFAGTIYAPTANQSVEGNSAFTVFPSGVGNVLIELVSSSNFSSPVEITGFDLRPDVNLCGGNPCGAFSTTLNLLTIDLATTSISNTSADTTYADYLTTNVQTVISGSLAISSNYTGPAAGPKDFDIHFPFSSPYSYNPSSGNLVMYMQIDDPNSGIPVILDAVSGSTSVNRIFGGSPDILGGICGCIHNTSGIGDQFGWVMQFDTAAVASAAPEPGTAWLLIPALLAMGARGRRYRKNHA